MTCFALRTHFARCRVETLTQYSTANQGAANNKSISTTGGGDSDAEGGGELLAAGYTKEELAQAAEKVRMDNRGMERGEGKSIIRGGY